MPLGTNDRPDWPLAVVVSAGGMGAAAARRLSQRHRVLLVDLDGERAGALAAAICAEGGDATSTACDITSPDDARRLGETVDRLGGFRVLCHVAGLSPSMGDFRTLLAVNLLGAANVAETMRERAPVGGAAILISSLAAHAARPSDAAKKLLRGPISPALIGALEAELGRTEATPQAAYGLSKYALLGYCRSQAPAWGRRGARIVSLSPGMIATPQGAREFEASSGKLRMFQQTPLGREGTMYEIADAIEFLASDRASFISGVDLLVDGGLAAALGLAE